MSQDKSSNKSQEGKPPKIVHKKRTYQLKGISYMSLSVMYLTLIIATTIIGLILLAYYSNQGKVVQLVLTALTCGGLIFSLFNIGVKYGEYGLEIIIGKAFQKKHIKNDFPNIERQLLSHQLSKSQILFPDQTLSKKTDDTSKEK